MRHNIIDAIDLIDMCEHNPEGTAIVDFEEYPLTTWVFEDEAGGESLKVDLILKEGTLFVAFDASCLDASFYSNINDTSHISPWKINNAVLEFWQQHSTQFYTLLWEHIRALHLDNKVAAQTVYTGHGLGGCIAMMASVKSPPHELITFGMPLFTDGTVEELIRTAVKDKYVRLRRLVDKQAFLFTNVIAEGDSPTKTRLLPSPYVEPGDVLYVREDGAVKENPSRRWRLLTQPMFSKKALTALSFWRRISDIGTWL